MSLIRVLMMMMIRAFAWVRASARGRSSAWTQACYAHGDDAPCTRTRSHMYRGSHMLEVSRVRTGSYMRSRVLAGSRGAGWGRALMRSLVPLLGLVVACSDTPTAKEEPSATPRIGSLYRFHRYDADSSGAPIPGSGDTAETRLVATDAHLAGASSVHVFVQGTDTIARLRYDASGDVHYHPQWATLLGSGWITLPIASRAP